MNAIKGELAIGLTERAGSFTGEIEFSLETPKGKSKVKLRQGNVHKIKLKDEGAGNYTISIKGDDQDKVWSQCWAPSDANEFRNPANDFEIVKVINVADVNNEAHDHTIELVEIKPVPLGTGQHDPAKLSQGLKDIAQNIPQWVADSSPEKVAQMLADAFCNDTPCEAVAAASDEAQQAKVPLVDQSVTPIDIRATCLQCYQLYTTPGTIYYMNANWYYNCRNNPPCT